MEFGEQKPVALFAVEFNEVQDTKLNQACSLTTEVLKLVGLF